MKLRCTPAMMIPAFLMLSTSLAAAAPEHISLSSVINQQADDQSTSSIPEQSTRKPIELLIGPEASVFFPTLVKTQKTYGKSWGSIGAGLGSAYQANVKGTFSPFFTILYNSHNGNRAFLLPFGIAYSKSLSAKASSFYYSGDALILAADQRAVEYNIHSGFRYSAGARVAFGYEIGKSAYFQASYLLAGPVKTYNFSGTSLEAGIRF